jgi:hypothetical protein
MSRKFIYLPPFISRSTSPDANPENARHREAG